MRLRRLNDRGIADFKSYLEVLRQSPAEPPPLHLLEDDATSEPLPGTTAVERREFPTRLAAAEYLYTVLSKSGLPNIDRDQGLWTWLTLFYFDQVCPAKKDGSRSPGDVTRYVPNLTDNRRYYRHLTYGPFAMYRMYNKQPEVLTVLLSSSLSVATSETYRLFIEHSELLSCQTAVSVANTLYYDPSKCKLRRGAGSKNEGGCRRLIDFLEQISLTYDLYSMSQPKLIQLLPKEFRSYLKHATNLFSIT